MNKLKVYQWATWSFLLLNILMVSAFFITKPKHPRHRGLKHSASQEMNLTDEQKQLFFESAEKHEQQIKALKNQQKELWQSYFKALSMTNDNEESDSIVLQLQKIEKRKIEITSTHFSEVKAFLKHDQYNDFSIFLGRLLDRNFKKRKNHPPPPKDF